MSKLVLLHYLCDGRGNDLQDGYLAYAILRLKVLQYCPTYLNLMISEIVLYLIKMIQ